MHIGTIFNQKLRVAPIEILGQLDYAQGRPEGVAFSSEPAHVFRTSDTEIAACVSACTKTNAAERSKRQHMPSTKYDVLLDCTAKVSNVHPTDPTCFIPRSYCTLRSTKLSMLRLSPGGSLIECPSWLPGGSCSAVTIGAARCGPYRWKYTKWTARACFNRNTPRNDRRLQIDRRTYRRIL